MSESKHKTIIGTLGGCFRFPICYFSLHFAIGPREILGRKSKTNFTLLTPPVQFRGGLREMSERILRVRPRNQPKINLWWGAARPSGRLEPGTVSKKTSVKH